ncbi:MAG: DEAD/DEAH box helicase [Pseudomonadota bacterium]|nr:DEAD/DEAH box helicase [Syntrophobacterales bacterium]MDI9554642.1 DEAD/DEAH box helicase [Pseudomonadota bacterium]NLX30608.1 DEAD/DEAH box helicase [Deltaproteobacteria bacterium]HOF72556.1 DEAD/DEAH box helicase [Syntrophales bacterium]HOR31322.1 DEAD/DEAH box helicase [Syntrophales bacterium]
MIESALEALRQSPRFRDRIAHIEVLPAREPEYGELGKPLPAALSRYLDARGIRLYSHQCGAVEALRAGRNVILCTPTASGKTLGFDLPVFETLARDRLATALFVYPTKALSNDQLKVFREMERVTGIRADAAVYDGDTPVSRRGRIREISRIILTNPHELHHVLPWHSKWERFFRNLRYVVFDEAHRYRGVFGSNVAFVIRRLRRIARFYGASPSFVLSTATLANPQEFGEKLAGLPFDVISGDGSPRGGKTFLFYNPFFDGAGALSPHQETRDLFLYFVKRGLQTLCFTASRRMAELIALWSKEATKAGSALSGQIAAYRAGYLPQERREIEDALKRGLLTGVTSTNALEVGIDIGSLDCVIISGYPGTVLATWQQAGRSGRRNREALAVLVAFQDPLDQYLMKHPGSFFGKPHEQAIIDLANPYILSGQLLCAVAELPFDAGREDTLPGEASAGLLPELAAEGLVKETPHGWVYTGRGRPVEAVGLDHIARDAYRITCEGALLETMDVSQACREAHLGAVLLHQGESYVVRRFDAENRLVEVERRDVDYYTRAIKAVDLEILGTKDMRRMGRMIFCLGELEVTETTLGYKVIRDDQVAAREDLELPPLRFPTTGLWFTIPDELRRAIHDRGLSFGGALHALEHAMIAILPFEILCDRWDIGGLSTPGHPGTGEPTIFLYDGYEGGIGLTEKAQGLMDRVARLTLELIRDCPCETGCPACILSPKCGNDNRPMDKQGALLLLEGMLDRMR